MSDPKIAIALTLLLLALPGLIIWRFARRYFRVFLLLYIAQALIAGYIFSRSYQPTKDPAIGKRAYLIENGKYLGVVEGAGEDRQRGDVWVVRPPGRYPVMYSKSRVRLADQ